MADKHLFIDDKHIKDFETKYYAGYVSKHDDGFIVSGAMAGAEETFSIGQPVYDTDHNMMGYLSIGLYQHLDYSADMRIPVEYWKISLPTRYCIPGKEVRTYWQEIEASGKEKE